MAKLLTTPWTTAAIVAGSICPSRSALGSFLAPLEGLENTTTAAGSDESWVFVELSDVDQSVTGTNAEGTILEHPPSATTLSGKLSTQCTRVTDAPKKTNATGSEKKRKWGAELMGGILRDPDSVVQQVQDLLRAERLQWDWIRLRENEKQFKVRMLSFGSTKPHHDLGAMVQEVVSRAVECLPPLENFYDLGDDDLERLEKREVDKWLIRMKSESNVFRAKMRGSECVHALKPLRVSARGLTELLVLSKLKLSKSSDQSQPLPGGLVGAYLDHRKRRICIAMHLGGQNLYDELYWRYVTKDFFSVCDLLNLALKMTQAVRACHRRGCVHRDIKLTKFVRDGNNLRLVGFTVAAPCTNGIVDTSGGDAPEITRCREDGTPYDRRVDIFSLGKAIGMLASHNDPWSDADFSVRWQHSEKFLQLLKNMTNEDPNKRPSLEEVELRLRQWY